MAVATLSDGLVLAGLLLSLEAAEDGGLGGADLTDGAGVATPLAVARATLGSPHRVLSVAEVRAGARQRTESEGAPCGDAVSRWLAVLPAALREGDATGGVHNSVHHGGSGGPLVAAASVAAPGASPRLVLLEEEVGIRPLRATRADEAAWPIRGRFPPTLVVRAPVAVGLEIACLDATLRIPRVPMAATEGVTEVQVAVVSREAVGEATLGARRVTREGCPETAVA